MGLSSRICDVTGGRRGRKRAAPGGRMNEMELVRGLLVWPPRWTSGPWACI
jgi:hypothetical protein